MFEREESYVMKYCLYFFGLCRSCNVPVDYGELEEDISYRTTHNKGLMTSMVKPFEYKGDERGYGWFDYVCSRVLMRLHNYGGQPGN